MLFYALPLSAVFAPDVVEAIEETVWAQIRKALAEHDRHQRASEWMDPAQMAERLGISPEAVRKRALRGRLESRHQGRRLLVRLGDDS